MCTKNLRQHRCCFTGHRPNKLRQSEQEIKPLLEKAIDWAIDNGFVTFISGMAEGVDIWAAEIILDKRKSNADLHLICALPHPGFENRRSMSEKARFQKIIAAADFVKLVGDRYFTGCYQVRNEFMVDHSSLVIAAFNGIASGTKNTVDYAKRRGVRVINILK